MLGGGSPTAKGSNLDENVKQIFSPLTNLYSHSEQNFKLRGRSPAVSFPFPFGMTHESCQVGKVRGQQTKSDWGEQHPGVHNKLLPRSASVPQQAWEFLSPSHLFPQWSQDNSADADFLTCKLICETDNWLHAFCFCSFTLVVHNAVLPKNTS